MARLSCFLIFLAVLQASALPVIPTDVSVQEKRSDSSALSMDLLKQWPRRTPFTRPLLEHLNVVINFISVGAIGSFGDELTIFDLIDLKLEDIDSESPRARGPASLNINKDKSTDFPWLGCRRYQATTQDPILWDNNEAKDYLRTLRNLIDQSGFAELDMTIAKGQFMLAECKLRRRYGSGWGEVPTTVNVGSTETW